MERILEPEIMDGKNQAIAYANADFNQSNQYFVNYLIDQFPEYLDQVLDIGCGPADVPILLLQNSKITHITAIDASASMLALAQQRVQETSLEQRLTLQLDHLSNLHIDSPNFTAIYSKDMLHHLPDASILWETIRKKSGSKTAVCIMDLYRPASNKEAWKIMRSVSSQEADILQRDFYNSLLAAFSLEEIEAQIKAAELELQVEKINERHFIASGFVYK